MIFNEDSASPGLALFCAQALRDQQDGIDANDIGLRIAQLAGASITTRNFLPTSAYPRMTYHECEAFGLWLISGTGNLSQAGYLVSAWSIRIPNDGTPGLPEYFDTIAFTLLQRTTSVGSRQARRIYYAGHSLGGAIAEAGAVRRNFSVGAGETLSLTFGSPRVGDSRFRDRLARASNTRWMNDDDPVPLLPPQLPSSIPFAAGLGTEVLSRWESFVHGGGGIVLDRDGHPRQDVLPPLGRVDAAVSLAAWVLKSATDRSSPHALEEYVRRLTLMQPLVTPPVSERIVQSPVERTHTVDRPSSNRQVEQWRDTIVHTGATQNQAALKVPPERAFQTIKVDGLWWVVFGGFLVAVGPTRKRAGAMATRGNEFLRRLQRMAGVDVQALQTLLPIYLEAASAPNNGFEPLIVPIANG